MTLELGKPYARHAMWWTDDDVYLYRLVLDAAQPVVLELEPSS
jgi:hypothetical protein